MKNTRRWNEIVTQTNRTWVVHPTTDLGCPLDWIAERNYNTLKGKGFVVIPGPGLTLTDLFSTGMLESQ